MKKILSLVLISLVITTVLSGCTNDTNEEDDDKVDEDTDPNYEAYDDNWDADFVYTSECNIATDIMITMGSTDHPQVLAGMYKDHTYCDLRYYYYDNGWNRENVSFESVFIGEEADTDVDDENKSHICFGAGYQSEEATAKLLDMLIENSLIIF